MTTKYPKETCTCWKSNKKLKKYTTTSECPKHKEKKKNTSDK